MEVYAVAKSHLVISMIDLLRSSPGITIAELAAHFGKSERSIYRWLREISTDLRLPVQYRDGGYHLPSQPETRTVSLTPQELLVLRMSLKSRLFGSGSPFKQHAESAWNKIRDAAPSADLESTSDLAAAHSIGVSVPPFEVDPDVAQAIQSAVVDCRRLRVVYRSQKSDQVKDYTIDPYALVFRRHSWYVLAFSHEHEKVIQMRLGRFQRVQATRETFRVPLDFSVDDHFRWSWEAWAGGEPTRVVVRFHPRVAKMIAETERHPTQVVHVEEDGSAVFEATVSGIQEFGSWVLGYGEYATVLQPKSLRDLVLTNARGILSNHQPEPRSAAVLPRRG
jgi:predicted DNA-binding transcriptional regulator YafY